MTNRRPAREHDDDAPDHRDHDAPLSDVELRVRALESLLVDKGLVDRAALDAIIDTYETKVGPRNGARIVARAWVDPAYRAAPARRRDRGSSRARLRGRQSEQLVVVENTPRSTTSLSAPSVPATHGRCWGCRPSGTSPRRIAPAP